MNYETVERACIAWVKSATLLQDAQVRVADQNIVPPAGSPSVTVEAKDLDSIGVDGSSHTFKPGNPAGQEIEYEAHGGRYITVELHAYTPRNAVKDASARSYLQNCQIGLALPSIRGALNRAGLGLMQQGKVISLPVADGVTFGGHAVLEVQFYVQATATEKLGYIATAVTTTTVTEG